MTRYYLYLTEQKDVRPLEFETHSEMAWVPLDPSPPFFWPEQRTLVDENKELIEDLIKDALS